MYHFFKYKKPLFESLCDFHSHLLPGIDDGSKSLGMSLSMLENYLELGFKSVISTPHVYQELYPNTPETIQKAFKELSAANHTEKSPEILSYGAEYMVDEIFMKNLEKKLPVLLINKKYILVEIHFFGGTKLLEKACFKLSQKGIVPILAHPERYQLLGSLSQFQSLKQKGFYLQLNALSLLGYYGPEVKQKAETILLAGLYDFVGTDAHNPNHLKTLQKLRLSKKQGLLWEGIREFQLDRF